MENVDVSIIIVNWNTKDITIECIKSIFMTTDGYNIELIVVDNGSSDGSSHEIREHFQNVILICNEDNVGFSRANNQGIKEATGRYICLVNSDTVTKKGTIAKMISFADRNTQVGMIGARTVDRYGVLDKNCRRFPKVRNAINDYLFLRHLFPKIRLFEGRTMTSYDYDSTSDIEVLSGCYLLVRMDLVYDIGMLDEDFYFYGEDTDWCKRSYDAGWRNVYLHEAEAVHYGGGSSRCFPAKYYAMMVKADYLYWKKHNCWLQRSIYVFIKLIYHSVLGVFYGIKQVIHNEEEIVSEKYRGHILAFKWLLLRC